MNTAATSNISALALVIQASLAELRICAEDMAQDVRSALPRLIDEASVLSGALQRLDRALDDAPALIGQQASRGIDHGLDTEPEVAPDIDLAEKWLIVLDRARRKGAGRQCPKCKGVF